MVSAVGAFMDGLGVRQAAVAGNSWSGGWALAFAQRHPDRVTKLALLDATGLDLPGTLTWEPLKIPVIGELAVKLSTGKSTVRSLAEGMMVNKGRVTEQLLDEWWAPMTSGPPTCWNAVWTGRRPKTRSLPPRPQPWCYGGSRTPSSLSSAPTASPNCSPTSSS
ncbi:alpha/beta fold hydrolase [Micromonospora sp. KC606]|nr:alpha/beta fold hydrolase [Micromonospora sp. KC606]